MGGSIISNVPSTFAAAAGFTATTSYQITGLLNITTAGVYKFAANVDDFQSLVVDGIAPREHQCRHFTYGELYLTSGLHVLNYRAGNNGTNGTIGSSPTPARISRCSVPSCSSALFQAVNPADLNTTFTTGATLAATTSATIDIAVNTSMGAVAMTGTGAGTVLNVTGSGNNNKLTISGITMTDSLTLGQAAVNSTALISAGTIDNTSASAVTLTLSNTGNTNAANINAITGNITQSGGGALSIVKNSLSSRRP